MFCSLLGSMAGNLALTFGARGGVYSGYVIDTPVSPALEGAARML